MKVIVYELIKKSHLFYASVFFIEQNIEQDSYSTLETRSL